MHALCDFLFFSFFPFLIQELSLMHDGHWALGKKKTKVRCEHQQTPQIHSTLFETYPIHPL